ncbi:hypothetical protein BK007_03920 [Methanobacterium subterraneum]|uniref:Uncharacterized protein n=1 Tax=Methanobacterium subterraneum TaxID=59277 RepID=A0A2H4VAX2_9EURY|nr:HNH endonuclease [Methanobacterium subterraneum]AUB55244.1 hypothetical protein BK007_03920 [Methanobacterium subterraneum]
MKLNVLKINQEYTSKELEIIFDTKFGYGPNGINIRILDDKSKHILLFATPYGPYENYENDNKLYYEGEGPDKTKDQVMERGNYALKNANTNNYPIYGFQQHEKGGKWKYIGILNVLDYKHHFRENGTKYYVFELKRLNIELPEEKTSQFAEIIDATKNKPNLVHNRDLNQVNQLKREPSFSRLVKEIYDEKCAVCGKKRFSKTNYPEVEACHIVAVKDSGPEDPRNGISLCKFHHWAFEYGLFSIRDDYTIITYDKLKNDDNYAEISEYENKKILLPNNDIYLPHKFFLEKHRMKHGFE